MASFAKEPGVPFFVPFHWVNDGNMHI